jgi:opacity protein-like surface antigen
MNNINKLMLTTALVASLSASAPALAQVSVKNFVGPSVSIGMQASTFKTATNGPTQINNNESWELFQYGSSFSDSTHALGRIAAQYGIQAGEKFVIGVGASYTAGSAQQDIKNTYGGGSYSDVDSSTLSVKYKNMMSAYVAPTFVVSDTTAVFAKVSYNKADAEMTLLSTYGDKNFSSKKSVRGLGYGIGVTTFLSKDIFLTAELEQINYKGKTADLDGADVSFKPQQKNATISLGVKF